MDDLKISHINKNVVEDIIRLLSERFGKEIPHSNARGKVLEYLVMTLDYMTKGKMKISMYEYIEKLLTELPSDINGLVKTPAASHLFNVNKDMTKLPDKSAQLFQQLVYKLLYLS